MRFTTRLAATALIALASPASADTVCEWMDFARKALPSGGGGPPGVTNVRTGEGDHAQAKAALAMFEALNAIDHRYRSYVGMPVGDASADQQVAAITAVHAVLSAQSGVNKAIWTAIISWRWRAFPKARRRRQPSPSARLPPRPC